MQAEFHPTGAQTVDQDIGFIANTVIIDTGPNFVTIYPNNRVIPPWVTSAIIPLYPPSSTANFSISLPDLGTSILPSLNRQPTTITFTDKEYPANPGIFTSPSNYPLTGISDSYSALRAPIVFDRSIYKSIGLLIQNLSGAPATISISAVENWGQTISLQQITIADQAILLSCLGIGYNTTSNGGTGASPIYWIAPLIPNQLIVSSTSYPIAIDSFQA